MNESQIESILRAAPLPSPPHGLRNQLQADLSRAFSISRASASVASSISHVPGWRRWVPTLSFALLFVGCLVVLGVQTARFRELRGEHGTLQAAAARLEALQRDNEELSSLRASARASARRSQDAQELAQLRAEAASLRGQLGELPGIQAANKKLQAEHDALAGAAVPANDPLAIPRDRSTARQCVNNLKQIGLAARIWAYEHKTHLLPVDWLQLQKALPSPKVLTCPGDGGRTPALTWDEFDGSSVSYQLPSAAPSENEPDTVYSRCPVHGSAGLTDGSARLSLKPESTVMIDGNLKLRSNATIEIKPKP